MKAPPPTMMDSPNFLLLLVFTLLLVLINGSNEIERQPYIVYMGDAPEITTMAIEDHHQQLLISVLGDENVTMESKIHSYGKSFNGFVARLLPHEAQRLKGVEGVVSVFPNTKRKLHTTRSWDFLEMPQNVKRKVKMERDVIIGVIDTGIYMDSPSFSDKGIGPPPAKWKGKCAKKDANFTGCNNKVIGAKYYRLENSPSGEPPSPADLQGHGTHTSSTAGGVSVKGASFFGLGKGMARGGAPSARLAMYKVCWLEGCSDMDILHAFDEAIDDGVDLISVSIGGPAAGYFNDSIAIGAYHAMKRGILTVCSAGNDGVAGSVTNIAPWILTVAASGMDRQFSTEVRLGNGKKAQGMSLNTFSPKKKMYPLTSGSHAVNETGSLYGSPSSCDFGTLNTTLAKGKIVYCLPGPGGQDHSVQFAGGVGTIIQSSEMSDTPFTFLIPTASVTTKVGDMIERYINSTKNAKAVIEKSKAIKISAPFTASFSSRGPNTISPNILKPDIAAPGLGILAAWSPLAPVTSYSTDNRKAIYNIISGTSMACPHVTGVAAFVKSFHPAWSPAAIKSAIMTSATVMKIKDRENAFSYGSGQIDPIKAAHPGLVYDLAESSYNGFLCHEGYNDTMPSIISGGKRGSCSTASRAQGSDGLNYPSMQFALNNPSTPISATFYRTVTNVGLAKAVYKATVTPAEGLSISVVPNTLKFSKMHEKKSFKVQVTGSLGNNDFLSAMLEWSDKMHVVRSPIVVYYLYPDMDDNIA